MLKKNWPTSGSYRDPDTPATGLHYSEIAKWCQKKGFRLPTPEQWEYACRAGSNTRYFWGDEFDESHCWYAGNSGERSTCIGTDQFVKCLENGDAGHWGCEKHFEPPRPHSPKEHDDAGKHNAFGLVDCIGNVWEWAKGENWMGGCYASPEGSLWSISIGRFRAHVTEWREIASNLLHSVGFRPIKTIPGMEE